MRILTKIIDFWYEIFLITDLRYVKIYCNRLLNLDQNNNTELTKKKHDWVTQFENLILKLYLGDSWNSESTTTIKRVKENILTSLINFGHKEDTLRINNSSYLKSKVLFKGTILLSQLGTGNQKNYNFIMMADAIHFPSRKRDLCKFFYCVCLTNNFS